MIQFQSQRLISLSQFHSLLSDPLLNAEENLVVSVVDPFTKYESPMGPLVDHGIKPYGYTWNRLL